MKQFGLILEKYENSYKSCMSDMTNVIAKLLQDPYPEVKKVNKERLKIANRVYPSL